MELLSLIILQELLGTFNLIIKIAGSEKFLKMVRYNEVLIKKQMFNKKKPT